MNQCRTTRKVLDFRSEYIRPSPDLVKPSDLFVGQTSLDHDDFCDVPSKGPNVPELPMFISTSHVPVETVAVFQYRVC